MNSPFLDFALKIVEELTLTNISEIFIADRHNKANLTSWLPYPARA